MLLRGAMPLNLDDVISRPVDAFQRLVHWLPTWASTGILALIVIIIILILIFR